MTKTLIDNETMAVAQKVTRRSSGLSERSGENSRISGMREHAPYGDQIFRRRLRRVLAEAVYYGTQVGTSSGLPVSTDQKQGAGDFQPSPDLGAPEAITR